MTAARPSTRPTASRFEILDEAECMRLLAREPVGRIGLTSAALPVVLPVNFVMLERTIVFASDPGLKLEAARAGQVACLEVDGYEVLDHSGWSVLATGRLAEIVDPERLTAARQLPLSPWALTAPEHYVELSIELLSGRRIRRP
jgi:nitroimidazol reductase NimA-like FMN-containing flavoprotein (pyridoxamine 5'-phosphate oxidase superfamily)